MIKLSNFSYKYPDTDQWVLNDINLDIPTGELCLIMGPSGIGKSTLLKSFNGLVPYFSGGEIKGEIEVCGLNPIISKPSKMSEVVGYVFQDPEKQFIFDQVEDEIRFNLENSGYPPEEISNKIDSICRLLDIHHLLDRQMNTLSGGEKQIVCIASALVMEPQILVLDEPTSQLDPQNANQILSILEKLKEQTALTIILSEHRLERILPFTDKVILMQKSTSQVVIGEPNKILNRLEHPPTAVKFYLQTIDPEVQSFGNNSVGTTGGTESLSTQPAVLSVENLNVKIHRNKILTNTNLELYSGEIHCLMGKNGSGKTTLLRTIMGVQKKSDGQIFLMGENIQDWSTYTRGKQIAYLPQDPNALLFAETVKDEFRITLENHHIKRHDQIKQIDSMLKDLDLYHKANDYPRDLSVGERQRTALGSVTVINQSIIMLDEPTRGLDFEAKRKIQNLLVRWKERGASILLVTHDVEWIYKFADRISIMDSGSIIDSGKPIAVLDRSDIFTPSVYRILTS